MFWELRTLIVAVPAESQISAAQQSLVVVVWFSSS